MAGTTHNPKEIELVKRLDEAFRGSIRPAVMSQKLRQIQTELASVDDPRILKKLLNMAIEQVTALAPMAYQDSLTGIPNRRAYDNHMQTAFVDATLQEKPFTLLVIDIDHFGHFNNTFGHDAGDYVLQKVTERIANTLRTSDTVARLGGEEIAVILPNSILPQGLWIAQRIRNAIAKLHLQHPSTGQNLPPVTVSIGTAEALPGENPDEIFKRADIALYEAKQGGRNRIEIAPQERLKVITPPALKLA